MKGLIAFIEDYITKDELEWSTRAFTVNVDNIQQGMGIQIRDWRYTTKETITLDEDDLKYLFDKYYPLYEVDKNIETQRKQEAKEREIKALEDKIKKLRE